MNIREFAALCGVSASAASRILNYPQEKSRASVQTYQRVRQKAQEVGFRPNYAAKTLHTNKSNCIGVIIGYPTPINSMPIIKGISECAYTHQVSLAIASCRNNPRLELRAFAEMAYRGVDAIIWHPVLRREGSRVRPLHATLRTLARKLPIVCMAHSEIPGLFSFRSNRHEDAKAAALRQLAAGCKKFAIVSSAFNYSPNACSQQVFVETLRDHGITSENIVKIVLDDKKNPPDWSRLAGVDGMWMYYLFMLHPLLPQMRKHCDLKRVHVDGHSFVEDYALTHWVQPASTQGQSFSENFASLQYHLQDASHMARRATEMAISAMRDPSVQPFAEFVGWALPPHDINAQKILFQN